MPALTQRCSLRQTMICPHSLVVWFSEATTMIWQCSR
jgi:hypothetical protein